MHCPGGNATDPIFISHQMLFNAKTSLFTYMIWFSWLLLYINHFFKFKAKSSLDVYTKYLWGCPRDVMVKAMDCGIVVREFELQSRNYVHFRANTLGKGMNPLILPAMG